MKQKRERKERERERERERESNKCEKNGRKIKWKEKGERMDITMK